MANILRNAAIACGFAALALTAAPTLAQVVVVDPPYGGPYGYVVPPGYVSPHEGFAYVPGYRLRRSWDYPTWHDSAGGSYGPNELGWQPGWSNSAPANPCWPSQRSQNLC